MKKEDLLLVFDFLATALKSNNMEEEKLETIDDLKKIESDSEKILPNFNGEINLKNEKVSDGPEISKLVNPKRVNEIIDKVNQNDILISEDRLTKVFKQLEKNLANHLSNVNLEIRESIISEEDKQKFKNAVFLDLIDAKKSLTSIEMGLDREKNEINKTKDKNFVKEVEEQMEEDKIIDTYPESIKQENPFRIINSHFNIDSKSGEIKE